jgi:hypothetical protein
VAGRLSGHPQLQVDNEEIGNMIGKVDLDGMPVEAAVQEWIDANEERWRGWIELTEVAAAPGPMIPSADQPSCQRGIRGRFAPAGGPWAPLGDG